MKIGPKIGPKVLHRLTLPVTPETPPVERPCRKKALLIGINYSAEKSSPNRNCLELEGPHRDALGMRDLLVERCGYKEEDVRVMVDRNGVDPNLQPTRRNMMREIRALVRDAQPGDRFVFLYSGHSDQIPCRDRTEDDGFDEVLLPMDCTGSKSKKRLIVDNDLRKWLVNPLPPGAQLIAILDACHSGTLLDLDHYDCNKVYVPWISLGHRDGMTKRLDVVRKNDTFAPVLRQGTAPTELLDALKSQQPSSPLTSPSKHTLSLRHKSLKLFGRDQEQQQMQSLRRRRTTIAMSSTASVAAWAAEKTIKPAADVLKQIIPNAICMSPVSFCKCDGECSVGSAAGVPRVISLAACGDSQCTWEYKQGSMTQDLIHELRQHERPRLHDLVQKLAYSRYEVSLRLHGAAKRQHEAIKGGAHPLYLLERVNFQDVQIGGQEKLDMDMPFEF